MRRIVRWIGLAWLFFVLAIEAGASGPQKGAGAEPAPLDYNRDVRPILADKCFRCHGPDQAHREAGLRLDRREDAVADRDGLPALVPGKPEESEFYARISAEEPDERMPPRKSGLALFPGEVALLRAWIEQGAVYQPHWAFVAPQSAASPRVEQRTWPRNEVDAYVLAELERRGMAPSPEASREILLRRVTLDLTGLPRAPAELDAFLADRSPFAYERAVDRLLASPRFGERLALDWLDAARFADTNGYYTDAERQAWPWRDWVIRAFNQNMPFDRFTIEQLAGDLLPNATHAQKIATGFNRNHMVTNETGVIDEESRVGYVVDRTDTTATVWMGLTLGCARCHDHKFDPITQEEYYQLYACFNNVPETGVVKDLLSPPPSLSLPTAEQVRRAAELRALRSGCEARLKAQEPAIKAAMEAWEPNALAALAPVSTVGEVAHFDLDHTSADRGTHRLATTEVGELTFEPGVLGSAATFDATQYLEFQGPPALERNQPFSLTVWVKPGRSPTGCVVSKLATTPDARGFEVMWYKSQPRVHLVHEWGKSAIEVFAKQTFPAGEWHHLAISYDGRGKASGLTIAVDGVRQPLVVKRDDLSGSIATDEPWQIAWKGVGVGFEGSLDEVRFYDRPLSEEEVEGMSWRESLQGAIATPKPQRTKHQTERLRTYYITHHASEELRRLTEELTALRVEEKEARQGILSTLVMADLETPRETHILLRGQYDHPGQPVSPNTPAALGSLAADAPRNRLGLARWLVAPEHPLTARVAVNRYWQLIFGDGLVRTSNDFGLQGEPPTHPKLLDRLAVDFVRSGWDVKALVRRLVTSATYRQSSNFTRELLARDPENRLLARGPRYRLAAELIRDQALAVGGLLAARIGGPSVKPYQPPGLWEAVSYNGSQTYLQDHGDSLHRRSLYTFWKRQAPPPAMLTLDAPTRETCTVKRPRTNTPLQALALLNDVTYIEAARGLAARMMRTGGDDPARCIRFGFRAATGRLPTQDESTALGRLYRSQLNQQQTDNHALLHAGETPVDARLDRRELAAWTMTASVLLNLDETITRH